MSLYTSIPAPPDVHEAVQAVRNLLAASAQIIGAFYVQQAAHVYQHEVPLTRPDRYVVVRELMQAGGRRQSMNGLDDVPIQIMAAINSSRSNPHVWLSAIHRRIYAAVVGKKVVLTNGAIHLPLRRERLPVMFYDDQLREYYAAAEYAITLKPA